MRRMRLIRCMQGRTLADVSNCIFLTEQYLRSFEKEKYELKQEHIQRIAKMLSVSVEELCESLSKEDVKKYFNSNGSFKGRKAKELKYKEENKIVNREIIKACKNQACPLNKNCFCINDVVKEGRGTCAGQNLIKPKPINLSRKALY